MMILMAASALIIAVLACVIYKLFFSLEKNSKLIVHGKDHEPFVLERLTDKSAEFSAAGGQLLLLHVLGSPFYPADVRLHPDYIFGRAVH